MTFNKFPRTPHLFIMPGLNIRDDKVLSESEADPFYNLPIVIEEKVDGANVGVSFAKDETLCVQNRGNFITPGSHPQFDPLWEWIYSRIHLLQPLLNDRYILFGEWCYLKHSIYYTSLPDWFIGIDIFDTHRNNFLNTEQRNIHLLKLNVNPVPKIASGQFSKTLLMHLLSIEKSRLGGEYLEGLYIRLEDQHGLLNRAKIVQAGFVQNIDLHWSKKASLKNERLISDTKSSK
jgi:ATP-dependent RNA circularization protein (DNA/RNA ligase family)